MGDAKMESEINKVFRQGNSLAVVIPKSVAETLNIHEGTHMRISTDGKKIIMEVV